MTCRSVDVLIHYLYTSIFISSLIYYTTIGIELYDPQVNPIWGYLFVSLMSDDCIILSVSECYITFSTASCVIILLVFYFDCIVDIHFSNVLHKFKLLTLIIHASFQG